MRPSVLLAALALALPGAAPAGPSEPQRTPGAVETAAEPPRSSRLQGRAAVGRRTEVVGATVLVHASGDASRLFLTSSGEGGAFHVDGLPDGEYRVRVTRAGLGPVTKDGVRVRFPFRAVVEVTMQPGRAEPAPAERAPALASNVDVTLRGEVRERDGGPLPEVRLRLVRTDGQVDPRTWRSGPDGRFELDGLTAGEWRLDVQGVGFLPMRQPIDLGRDTELRVIMVRQPARYEPSPLELMPPEQPVPPAGFEGPG